MGAVTVLPHSSWRKKYHLSFTEKHKQKGYPVTENINFTILKKYVSPNSRVWGTHYVANYNGGCNGKLLEAFYFSLYGVGHLTIKPRFHCHITVKLSIGETEANIETKVILL